MNYQEIEQLLGAAMQIDDRITPDKFRIAGWVEILDSDMTHEFAMTALKAHYAEETNVIMPAHLNRKWRMMSRREREREKTRELSASVKVDRSPEVELLIEELKAKLEKDNLAKKSYKTKSKEHRAEPEPTANYL